MNDRFKFRVWNNMQKCYSPDDHYIDEDGFINTVGDYIIEQCTGLKDKNGELIYEGDIIFEDGIKHIIHWDEKEARFRAKISHFEDRFIDCGIGFDWVCYKEVIGNIHENEDLLK